MTLRAPASGLGEYLYLLVDLPTPARRPRRRTSVVTGVTSRLTAPFLWWGLPAHSLLCLATRVTMTAAWTSLEAPRMYQHREIQTGSSEAHKAVLRLKILVYTSQNRDNPVLLVARRKPQCHDGRSLIWEQLGCWSETLPHPGCTRSCHPESGRMRGEAAVAAGRAVTMVM